MKTASIINVLKFIRSTCEANIECKGEKCPFSDERYFCYFSDERLLPHEWDIEKLEEQLKDKETL